jgi:hypothetical protein
MSFPTASFLSSEGFGVVVVIGWILAIETRVINLLSYPSLACGDRRVTVVTTLHAVHIKLPSEDDILSF